MEQPQKKKLIKRLRNPYRLTVIHDESFHEWFSMRLTPMNVILALLGIFLVSGGLVYSLMALTPLREVVIPGYSDSAFRESASYSRVKVDSLRKVTEQQERYIRDLRIILSGGVIAEPRSDTSTSENTNVSLQYDLLEEDSLLRETVDADNPFGLGASGGDGPSLADLHLFKPLEGTLTSCFDRSIEHYGVDVVAPDNSMVKAAREGTVVLAEYTLSGGHEIHVQHDQNILTVYKHNSKLIKQLGDRVEVGEAIAVVGNTGNHSDGPHLHFELWIDGVPVDPEDYLSFSR